MTKYVVWPGLTVWTDVVHMHSVGPTLWSTQGYDDLILH